MTKPHHLYRSGPFFVVPAPYGFDIYRDDRGPPMRCRVINHNGDIGMTKARAECDRLAKQLQHSH